ncbi:neuferricin [Orussus abietinus]|uniref:neuferricin n=1 Tax=Orussus abietinus TaxID=222816 RepID=UPI000625989C|nr:neuferricin [Orussus abietinus]
MFSKNIHVLFIIFTVSLFCWKSGYNSVESLKEAITFKTPVFYYISKSVDSFKGLAPFDLFFKMLWQIGGSVLWSDRLFTKEELKQYTNLDKGLYLAILGRVYDVSTGARHYEPGANYHGFTGQDGSLAFITGNFDSDEFTDDVSSLLPNQLQSLQDWVQFYDKTYIYKGKLIGRFYGPDGNPTMEFHKLQEKLSEAQNIKMDLEKQKEMFPPCNVEWKADTGTTVWCSQNSGGIQRDWEGIPQLLFEDKSAHRFRCACVNINSRDYLENEKSFEKYKHCSDDLKVCKLENTRS